MQSEQINKIIELEIPRSCAGLRLDQALAQLLPTHSRKRIQMWIKAKRITADNLNVVAKKKVWGSEKIKIELIAHHNKMKYTSEPIGLKIIYEDQEIMVIDKPAGMVIHPGNGNWEGTMLNGLLHHSPQLQKIPRAGIVHRLDKNTSGLLVVAKTLEAQTSLVRQLQDRTMKRDYLALVHGHVQYGGQVNKPIGRHPVHRVKMAVNRNGKDACTNYLVKEQINSCCTLLQCSLNTGRTHQIRVHMFSIGHPLIGDPTYGAKPQKGSKEIRKLIADFPRQALHAQRLELMHPETGRKVMWRSELPKDIQELLFALRAELY